MSAPIYMYCKACGNYVYRRPGFRHGDGQVDSDEHPVWLLTDQATAEAEYDGGEVPDGYCGCND